MQTKARAHALINPSPDRWDVISAGDDGGIPIVAAIAFIMLSLTFFALAYLFIVPAVERQQSGWTPTSMELQSDDDMLQSSFINPISRSGTVYSSAAHQQTDIKTN